MYKLICVLIMCLVTYIPRAIPLSFFKKEIKSKFIRSFLFYVPYSVLATLTFPSILYATNNLYTAIFGGLVAILLAITNQKLIIVALASVLVVYGTSFLFM